MTTKDTTQGYFKAEYFCLAQKAGNDEIIDVNEKYGI